MARKPSAAEVRNLDAAQQVIYDAWEASGARRRALAAKALAISPLCADAYVIFAMDAEGGSDAELDYWRKGVAAGEAALGKQGFEEFAGCFWGFLETRPYMRARQGLAQALWARGEREQAIAHLQAMLELNPNDNQGLRYILAAHLIEEGRDGELAALLAKYENDASAYWLYSAALAAFRRNGDSLESRELLKAALDYNSHVADFLTGARPIPKRRPAFMGFGDENEAIVCAQDCAAGWEKTEGARDWLAARAQTDAPARKRTARKKAPPRSKARSLA